MKSLQALIAILEENPYHVPAGSSAGGQFAKGSGGSNRSSGMPSRSRSEIDKWESIIKKTGNEGKGRLRGYLGSLVLGREFGESGKVYYDRKGLTPFVSWAHSVLK